MPGYGRADQGGQSAVGPGDGRIGTGPGCRSGRSDAQEAFRGWNHGRRHRHALAWSQKYEELLKQQQKQTEKSQALVTENSDLKQTIDKLQQDLAKTKKELEEANVFLQDMHRELTQWKSDVLGYREEMRQAQSAQMEALIRILKVLGAETTELSKTQLEKPATTNPE